MELDTAYNSNQQHHEALERVKAGSVKSRRGSEVNLSNLANGQASTSRQQSFKPQRKTAGSLLLDLDIDEIISPEMRSAVKKTLAMNQMLAEHAAKMKKYFIKRKKQRALSAALRARGVDLNAAAALQGVDPISPGTLLETGSANLTRLFTPEVAKVVADVQNLGDDELDDDDVRLGSGGSNASRHMSRNSSRHHRVKFGRSMQRRHGDMRKSLEGKPDTQLDRFMAEHGGGSLTSSRSSTPERTSRAGDSRESGAPSHIRLTQSRESTRADAEHRGLVSSMGHRNRQNRHLPHPEWHQHGPFGPKPGSRPDLPSITIELPQPDISDLPVRGNLSPTDIMRLVGPEHSHEHAPSSYLQLPNQAHARAYSTAATPEPGSLKAKLSHQYWEGCLSQHPPDIEAEGGDTQSAYADEQDAVPLGIKVIGCLATQAHGLDHVAPLPGTRCKSRLSPTRASTSHGRVSPYGHHMPTLHTSPSLTSVMSHFPRHHVHSRSSNVEPPSPSASSWHLPMHILPSEQSRATCPSPNASHWATTKLDVLDNGSAVRSKPGQDSALQAQASKHSTAQHKWPAKGEVTNGRKKHTSTSAELLAYSTDMVNLSLAWLTGDRVPKPNSKQPLPLEARGRCGSVMGRLAGATTPCELLLARQQARVGGSSSEPGDGSSRHAGASSCPAQKHAGHAHAHRQPCVSAGGGMQCSLNTLCPPGQGLGGANHSMHSLGKITSTTSGCCSRENSYELLLPALRKDKHRHRAQPGLLPLPIVRG